jgi:hypothetical protein
MLGHVAEPTPVRGSGTPDGSPEPIPADPPLLAPELVELAHVLQAHPDVGEDALGDMTDKETVLVQDTVAADPADVVESYDVINSAQELVHVELERMSGELTALVEDLQDLHDSSMDAAERGAARHMEDEILSDQVSQRRGVARDESLIQTSNHRYVGMLSHRPEPIPLSPPGAPRATGFRRSRSLTSQWMARKRLAVGHAFERCDERANVGSAEAAVPAGRLDEGKEPALSPGGYAPATHLE